MSVPMEGLRLRELRTLSSFLRELYAVPDLKGFRTHILATLPKLVRSEAISYNEVNPRARRNEYARVPAHISGYEPVFLRYMGDHPLIKHHRKTRDGRALRISDILPQRRFRRGALYNEYFRPLRLDYQVALTLPAPLPLVVGVALSRGERDFTERDTQLLDMLRPHLIQAYRSAETFSRMRQLVAQLSGVADARGLLLEEQLIALSPRSLRPLGLTQREAEVMTWLVQGKTNAQIAALLGASPYTVIKHVQHIFGKLGVKTRTAAAAHVLKAVFLPAR